MEQGSERVLFEVDADLKHEFEIAVIRSKYRSLKEAFTALMEEFIKKQTKKEKVDVTRTNR